MMFTYMKGVIIIMCTVNALRTGARAGRESLGPWQVVLVTAPVQYASIDASCSVVFEQDSHRALT